MLLSPIQIKRVSCHSPTQPDTTELPAAVKVLSPDKTPTHLRGLFAPSTTGRAVHHGHLSAVSTQSPTHALAPLFFLLLSYLFSLSLSVRLSVLLLLSFTLSLCQSLGVPLPFSLSLTSSLFLLSQSLSVSPSLLFS